MFGYVKPYVPLLRVKDNEVYNAIYCGVCNSLDNCYGKISSATLSYDITFLAVVRLALSGEDFTVSKKKCRYNPARPCKIAHGSSELDFCAAVGILLTYYKLLDTVRDESGMKALTARIAIFLAAPKRKAVMKKYGETMDLNLSASLDKLSELEKSGRKSIDETSETFGKLLGDLVCEGLSGKNAIIARSIGEAVGQWIYIVDAVDDCEKDFKSGNYNPITALYGRVPSADEYENILLALAEYPNRIMAASDLIDYKKDCDFEADNNSVTSSFSDELREIIENTCRFGMSEVCKKILKCKTDK